MLAFSSSGVVETRYVNRVQVHAVGAGVPRGPGRPVPMPSVDETKYWCTMLDQGQCPPALLEHFNGLHDGYRSDCPACTWCRDTQGGVCKD